MDIEKQVNNMLLLQQIKVLPNGAHFIITDEGKIQAEGFKSESDGSIIFLSAYEADKYYKVYNTFKVVELKAELGVKLNNEQTIDYKIEVRG